MQLQYSYRFLKTRPIVARCRGDIRPARGSKLTLLSQRGEKFRQNGRQISSVKSSSAVQLDQVEPRRCLAENWFIIMSNAARTGLRSRDLKSRVDMKRQHVSQPSPNQVTGAYGTLRLPCAHGPSRTASLFFDAPLACYVREANVDGRRTSTIL